MTEGRLTQSLVKDLLSEPPAKGNRRRPHRELGGFELVVTSAGAGAFCYRYRNREGRERYYTIGDAKAWPLTAAEKEYRALRQRVEAGGDPAAERKGQREAPTVADLADRYKREHMPKLRASSAKEYAAIVDKLILPELRNIKVAGLRFVDVDRLHRKVAARTPYRANRMVAVLSKMLSLAVTWEWRNDNPCKGIERAAEEKRERYLSAREIGRLLDALDQHPERISANAIRLLLLTGARRTETLSATWDQFDLIAGVWVKPSHATKQAKSHRVPLSAPALVLLTEMQKEAATGARYIFPSGKGHLTEIKKTWASVCRAADINGARLHDLRHTFASVLASSGLSLPIIGQLLGHTQAATTARYAHLLDDPLRAATEKAAAIITGAGKPAAEVLPMPTRHGT